MCAIHSKWRVGLAAPTALLLSMIVFSGPRLAVAGSLDSPAAPTDPGSAMYKLEDIYNRLDTGAPGTPSAFAEPTAGPGATGHTLDEVMSKAPATNANAAVAGDVVIGATFWGLNSSEWGSNTGTRAWAPVPKTG